MAVANGAIAQAWAKYIDQPQTLAMSVGQLAEIRRAYLSGIMFILEGLSACTSNGATELEASQRAEIFMGSVVKEMTELTGG